MQVWPKLQWHSFEYMKSIYRQLAKSDEKITRSRNANHGLAFCAHPRPKVDTYLNQSP